jgi:hypothetical protein
MISQRFPRLEDLLGAPADEALTEAALEQLTLQRVPEADDLDFKVEYARVEDARTELAKDVAALANNVGGLLIVGIAEDHGQASRLVPNVNYRDAEARRVRSIVAQRVHPRPTIDVISVPSLRDEGKGFLVIAVRRSVTPPHAVMVPNEPHLTYWVRDGSRTRWIGESEVADRYAGRFAMVRTRLDRLGEVMAEGLTGLDRNRAWMAMAVVPMFEGRMALNAESRRRVTDWVRSSEPFGLGGVAVLSRGIPVRTSVGVRRVSLLEPSQAGGAPLNGVGGDLHVDGSTFFARSLGILSNDPVPLEDMYLVECVAAGLRLAARHAVENTSTGGEAVVEARVLAMRADEPAAPIVLQRVHLVRDAGGSDRAFIDPDRSIPGRRPLGTDVTGRHTVDLTAIASDPREWLAATRLVANDLVQAFGLDEVLQINDSGGIRPWHCGNHIAHFRQWAVESGLDVDETIVNLSDR